MFDDNQPEDIFAGSESKVAKPIAPIPAPDKGGVTNPATVPGAVHPSALPAAATLASVTVPNVEEHKGGGLVRTLVIVILALGAVATAAYLTYIFMVKPPAPVPDDTTDKTSDTTPTTTDTTGSQDQTPTDTTEPGKLDDRSAAIDSDGDGLTNAEEIEAGTAVTKSDTDSDGLGDREEVRVYGTDPRRTDTDGDTYLDGQEVTAGFNPNGPGKLLEIPTAQGGS